MITLHRLGHAVEAFHLNPDMILTVEANPDTVITLTTGTKIVVAEPPERVAAQVRRHRVEILASAMQRRDEQREEFPNPAAVRRLPARPAADRPVDRPADPEHKAL